MQDISNKILGDLTDKQKQAADTINKNLEIVACAGACKT